MPVALFGGLAGVIMLATWSDRFDPPALLIGAIGVVVFFAGLLWSNAMLRGDVARPARAHRGRVIRVGLRA